MMVIAACFLLCIDFQNPSCSGQLVAGHLHILDTELECMAQGLGFLAS